MMPNDMPPPIQMMMIMMGHWVGQTAAALAELEVPDHLGDGKKSADEVAKLAGANADAMNRLMRGAASVGILTEVEPRVYANTPLSSTLRKGTPGSLRDLVVAELAPCHWLPWGKLAETVKTGKSHATEALGMSVWEYYAKNAGEGACFARGMSNLSAIAAAEVLPSYDFTPFARIVDVGGSEGVMLAGALRAAPNAKGVLFDRPEVIERGLGAVNAHGLGSRLEAVSGDFLRSVPDGADCYILKSIVHDWDDAHCTQILKNVAKAAKPGAKVLVVEMVVPERVTPSPVHLMDLNMMVMLDGKERSENEFKTLFASAGLKYERMIPSPGLFAILEATRA